jgi:mannitol 2-dehydrogenase
MVSVASDRAVPLRQDTLSTIRGRGRVAVPTYDRAGLTVGIVHFGVGGFHRAHQAMVIDRLLQRGEARDWAICGVGVLPQDQHMAEVMTEQDHLYTLVLKHPDGQRESRVIGSIIDYLFAPDDPRAVIERMSSPDVRIVSLTVTEGGYNFDQVTGQFDIENPGVQYDLAHPNEPTTTFGFVVAALKLRRERGHPAFTVMSCDNIQGNGHIARTMFTAFARLSDPDFADWMEQNVEFPNCMVDRITPVTTDRDREDVQHVLGIEDQWPVVAEPFFQWVIEDRFSMGRPPFEDAGAQMVDDVEPYELMKLRLLNASHQGMCYFGYLAGYRYAHEATADPAIAAFLRAYMDQEATPTLKPVPGINLDEYKDTLIQRFSNPEIRDTLARLCAESSDRIPKWLVPVIRENLAVGGQVALSAAICASWARYAEGKDEDGNTINIVDRLASELIAVAGAQHDDELAFIRDRSLFGDLSDNEAFTQPYLNALRSLWSFGSELTIQSLAGGKRSVEGADRP